MTATDKPKAGLEDIVATSSAICYLDGDRGVLAYCGYDIHDLAKFATFEEVCYLLWHRRLPTRAELGDLQSQFAAERALPEPIIRLMRSLPAVDGMDAIRTTTSALAHYDPEVDLTSPAAQYRKAIRLTARIGTVVATWGRLQAGGGPIAPDPVMGQAANFLYMLTGNRPSGLATRAFDIALTLHADHELNASTFAARVAAANFAPREASFFAGLNPEQRSAIEATEGVDMPGHECGDIGFDGHISDLMTDLSRCTAAADAIGHVGEPALGASADGDVHAVLGQPGGTCCTDTGATTGDDRGAACER